MSLGTPAGRPEDWVDPDSRQPIIQTVWRFRTLVLGVAVLSAAALFGLAHLQAPRYQATAQLVLSDSGRAELFSVESRLPADDLSGYLLAQAEAATSTAALARASQMIGSRPGIEDLDEEVQAQAVPYLGSITITAVDATPGGVAEIADAVGQAYQDLAREKMTAEAAASLAKVESSRDELGVEIAELEVAIAADPTDAGLSAERHAAAAEAVRLEMLAQQIPLDAAHFDAGVQRFVAAEVPHGPIQSRPIRNAALGGVLGLLAAGGYALWLGRRHPVVARPPAPGQEGSGERPTGDDCPEVGGRAAR